jgi:hypothetical protein
MTTTKIAMQTVQKEADKRAKKIQLNFTQLMTTTKGKQSTKNKRTEEEKEQPPQPKG